MHLDVVALKRFYYASDLGRMAQRMIRAELRALWPNVAGMNIVGFGFAAPFLRPFMEEAERTLCLMPSQQGVCLWPAEGPNLTALVEETLWPLPKGFADRVVIAHGLESCERPHALIQEISRVLAPDGRVVFVLPNRSGLWARRDATPFGFGRPYSAEQIEKALAAHDLSIEAERAALYMPASHRRFWLRTGPMCERVGQRLDVRGFAGVRIVEAKLTIYISPHSGAKEVARTPLGVLGGLAPAPKPATSRIACECGFATSPSPATGPRGGDTPRPRGPVADT